MLGPSSVVSGDDVRPRTGIQVGCPPVVAGGVHVAGPVHGNGKAGRSTDRAGPADGAHPLGESGRVEFDGVRVVAAGTEGGDAGPGVPVAVWACLDAGGVHVAACSGQGVGLVVAAGTEVLRPLEIPHRTELRDPRIVAAVAAGRAANQYHAGPRVVVRRLVAQVPADVDVVVVPVDR